MHVKFQNPMTTPYGVWLDDRKKGRECTRCTSCTTFNTKTKTFHTPPSSNQTAKSGKISRQNSPGAPHNFAWSHSQPNAFDLETSTSLDSDDPKKWRINSKFQPISELSIMDCRDLSRDGEMIKAVSSLFIAIVYCYHLFIAIICLLLFANYFILQWIL